MPTNRSGSADASQFRLSGVEPRGRARNGTRSPGTGGSLHRRLSRRDAVAGVVAEAGLETNQRRAGFQSLRMVSLICSYLRPAASASLMAGWNTTS